MVLERYIVDYSAAVLADRKVGNLFLFPQTDNFYEEFIDCAERLCPFGVAITQFKVKTGRLIYVYRPDRLQEVLSRPECRQCLTSRGYQLSSLDELLEGFRDRIQQVDFPHEIGFILGYPTHDVLTFLNDVGKNPLITGYWQVYHDADNARQTFSELSECFARYKRLYNTGTPLEELVKGNRNEKNCCDILERNRQHRAVSSSSGRRSPDRTS